MFRLLYLSTLLLTMAGISSAATIFGVTTSNTLVRFDTAAPGSVATVGSITGLAPGDTILGIDMRPATGQLYGLGRGGVYVIDQTNGAATAVGGGAIALTGDAYGFDFNPTVDRIRITSTDGTNLRLNPITGALAATDGSLAYAAADVNSGATPTVSGSAYTNSFPGATTTLLYGIDSGLNVLVTQVPPNAGTLNTVGSLGVDPSETVGFDIDALDGSAYASFVVGGGLSQLYSIDLTTGAATLIGGIGAGEQLTSIAINQVPEPGTLALLGAGLSGLMLMRRHRR